MRKPTVLWIDLTVADQETELPEVFISEFNIIQVTNLDNLKVTINETHASAVCFDFDYADRKRLTQLVTVKSTFPSVPVLMLTLQHSEELAVWAYRNGVLDYLCKPVPNEDQRRCVKQITDIDNLKQKSQRKPINGTAQRIPVNVPVLTQNSETKLAPAVHYVQNNFQERIYSDTVARLCDISASHFSHAFRKNFGITFQEFLLRYRVAEACRLLRVPGACISNVAYGVGFSDSSYFTRVFRRYVGVSPTEYGSMKGTTANEIRLKKIANSTGLAAHESVKEVMRIFA